MESSTDKSQNENLIYDKTLNKDYLRFSAVFGENGSGKTSFLIALSLLHNIVLSNPNILHGQPLLSNEESSGIKSLLQFLCPLFDIFENGKLFVCDEIEQHLHPTAIRKIIEIFNSNKKSNAQIILTTHDIDLLDINLLRRDQIWFSYMKENHSSELFRLSDLRGVRKDDNLKKNYLEGKYKQMWIEQRKESKQ